MTNPYSNRAAIRRYDDFFGRRKELQRIYALILKGLCISLYGERRVGKTSILFALQFLENRQAYNIPDHIRFVSLNSQYFTDCVEGDVIEFLLDQISQEAGTSIRGSDRNLLRRAAIELREASPQRHVVVLLDEVDILVQNRKISPTFFSYLRAWVEEFQIPIVGTSREGSVEKFVETEGAGSPFFNFFQPEYIGPMPHDEALDLVRTPAERLRMSFTDSEVSHILALGGHQPFFLQIACDYIFRIKLTGKSRVDLEGVTEDFRKEAYPHFDYLIGHLPRSEAAATFSFALTNEPPSGKVLFELIRKGVVVPDDDGLRLFSSTLIDWLKSRHTQVMSTQTLGQKASDFLLS